MSHQRPGYSRAEFLSDSVVHITGLVVVALAVPSLIVLTLVQRGGDGAAILGVSVYGAALAAMISCSALYNMTPGAALRWLWRRFDHAAIYLKIAGTYTPFALLTGQGMLLTLGVWGAAALGVAMKLVSPERWRFLALALYLGMGWVAVIAGGAIFAMLPGSVVILMLVGGLIYTGGVAFYLAERMPYHNTLWHVCVLVASLLFYAAVVALVVLGSG
ncbi:MAG: hemolysin III family protein [Rhodobacteraceae bacterium]|nr:hemolysin III family protein [Paracoccaceae bacterium]